jgi:hypothetical protein
MYVPGTQQPEQLARQDICRGSMSILIQSRKELLSQSNPITIVRFNPPLIIVATMSSLAVDEYGFLLKDSLHAFTHLKFPNKAIWRQISRGVGRGNHVCKDLCRLFPKADSRTIFFNKTGDYYCGTCEIAMKCCRCRCCGRQGRAKPRGRHKRLDREGAKFVE